jgi:hypothetical protein
MTFMSYRSIGFILIVMATTTRVERDANRGQIRTSWLAKPLSGWWCLIGWLSAAAVSFGWVEFMGGPVEQDLAQSGYSAWAIAHGRLSCAYAPATAYHFPYIARPTSIAPLWSIMSGGLAALFRIGDGVPFPSKNALGPHCGTALVAIYKWSVHSNAALPTARLAYFSLLVLMAGVVALLRASGRGRCGWEILALLLVACAPPVWEPLIEYFHPQDLVAMGLVLGGLACIRRGNWVWAGVLLALAVTSQQFALLAFVPVAVVIPSRRRVRFLQAAIITVALVDGPLLVLTSGRALKSVVFGSGSVPGFGGSVLWELHLPWSLLTTLSRALPIVFSLLLATWALRRLGPAILEPVPLISLVALSLSFRLFFEVDLFGYYYMALAVSMILLDICRGRIRGQVVAWFALVALAYNPVPFGFVSNVVNFGLQAHLYLPIAGMLIALLLIAYDAIRGQIRWYLVAWLAVTAFAFAKFPLASVPLRHPLPTWFWQVVLVTSGAALAASPLLSAVNSRGESTAPPEGLEAGVA